MKAIRSWVVPVALAVLTAGAWGTDAHAQPGKDKDKKEDHGKPDHAGKPGHAGTPAEPAKDGAGKAADEGKPEAAGSAAPDASAAPAAGPGAERREARKAKREDKRKAAREEAAKKWGQDKVGRPAIREELRRHAMRIARLEWMLELAEEKKKDDKVTKIKELIEKENARHQTKMDKLSKEEVKP